MLSRTIVPLWLVLAASSASAQVTPPAEHLGRPVGRDFELADWTEVSSYFERLGSESPRVDVRSVGSTTEGRSFLLATISSEENLENIDAIRAASKRLADPRGLDDEGRERLLAEAKPVLFASIGMHSTETAAPQFGMEMAYDLATSDAEPYRTVREEMVVLIAPCLNPDGLDHVVNWYRQTVGTPYESSGLLKLYQYYSGHDNNRDWFMLSQAETRIVTEILYGEWFPQVYWDVHQQGSTRERMFVPPFRDPLNPNLDPGIIAGIGQLGARALFDMTREGFTGVSTGVTYDMWWNGGNRNVPVRHNIIGLLTEAASVNIASPIWVPKSELSAPRGLGGYAPSNRFPEPWPGGWWRIRDIIDYEHGFARSLLGSIAREPRLWLENALDAATRAVEAADYDAPRAWVLPSSNPDVAATRRLVDSLLLGGVEVHVVDGVFEADGRVWPPGSIVILRGQPYGQHVKDLMEVQRYPEGDPPYDVAGWTLPLLLGVHRVEVMESFDELSLRRVTTPAEAVAGFPAREGSGATSSRNGDAWIAAFRRLLNGEPVSLVVDEEEGADGEEANAEEPSDAPEAVGHFVPRIEGPLAASSVPRVGLYAPWSGSMDEGWMRFALDSFGVPFVTVRNETLRAGQLAEVFDVLLIASIWGGQLDRGRSPGSVPPEYTRGLAPEGAAAIEEFVREGGKVVAVGSSAQWAIELFDLPLEDVTRGDGDFSCPGSVLRTIPADHVLTTGLPSSLPIFFSRSAAWTIGDAKEDGTNGERTIETLLRYAPTRVLLSGWIRSPEVIADHAAWVAASHGKGRVHLFGFRPQYRGWSQGSFQLLFRAILF